MSCLKSCYKIPIRCIAFWYHCFSGRDAGMTNENDGADSDGSRGYSSSVSFWRASDIETRFGQQTRDSRSFAVSGSNDLFFTFPPTGWIFFFFENFGEQIPHPSLGCCTTAQGISCSVCLRWLIHVNLDSCLCAIWAHVLFSTKPLFLYQFQNI